MKHALGSVKDIRFFEAAAFQGFEQIFKIPVGWLGGKKCFRVLFWDRPELSQPRQAHWGGLTPPRLPISGRPGVLRAYLIYIQIRIFKYVHLKTHNASE